MQSADATAGQDLRLTIRAKENLDRCSWTGGAKISHAHEQPTFRTGTRA